MSTAPRIILITGATRGLGLALARRFQELGHTVLGCGRNPARVDRLADSFPSPHDLAVVDVARGAQVQKWAMRLLGRHGAPDLLLNNAALINRNAPLWEVTAEEFDAVIDVNIKGVANVLRSFLPAMMARGRGAIVNFSSGWGREPAPEVAPYCATKFAMEGLTGALAQELPHGLAAVALNPGIIATDMLRSCFGPSAEDYPSPEKWSRWAAPFLLKLGRKDNGQSLTIPGSMT